MGQVQKRTHLFLIGFPFSWRQDDTEMLKDDREEKKMEKGVKLSQKGLFRGQMM